MKNPFRKNVFFAQFEPRTPKIIPLDPGSNLEQIPTVCGSLREALESLDSDRTFLTDGDVFTDEQIDGYIELKMEDVINLEHTPSPIEFKMYYSS